jgi:hypothetical protein
MVHRRRPVAPPMPGYRRRHAGGMKLHAGWDCTPVSRLCHSQVGDMPFRAVAVPLRPTNRTIVRSCADFRGQCCDSTFICLANSLFFNWNCFCAHHNAKSLFDKRKPVDRGLERTYSGAKWQKVGQSGLDFDRNRLSEAAGAVAGD